MADLAAKIQEVLSSESQQAKRPNGKKQIPTTDYGTDPETGVRLTRSGKPDKRFSKRQYNRKWGDLTVGEQDERIEKAKYVLNKSRELTLLHEALMEDLDKDSTSRDVAKRILESIRKTTKQGETLSALQTPIPVRCELKTPAPSAASTAASTPAPSIVSTAASTPAPSSTAPSAVSTPVPETPAPKVLKPVPVKPKYPVDEEITEPKTPEPVEAPEPPKPIEPPKLTEPPKRRSFTPIRYDTRLGGNLFS
jgi:hypothetical protein